MLKLKLLSIAILGALAVAACGKIGAKLDMNDPANKTDCSKLLPSERSPGTNCNITTDIHDK